MILYDLCTEVNKTFKGNCFIRNRERNNVECRIAISAILRTRKFYTLKSIGNVFKISHDNVIHYLKKHDELMSYNNTYRERFTSLIEILDNKSQTIEFSLYCLPQPFKVTRHR